MLGKGSIPSPIFPKTGVSSPLFRAFTNSVKPGYGFPSAQVSNTGRGHRIVRTKRIPRDITASRYKPDSVPYPFPGFVKPLFFEKPYFGPGQGGEGFKQESHPFIPTLVDDRRHLFNCGKL